MAHIPGGIVPPNPTPMQSTQYGYLQRPPPPMPSPMLMYKIIHYTLICLLLELLQLLLLQPLPHFKQ